MSPNLPGIPLRLRRCAAAEARLMPRDAADIGLILPSIRSNQSEDPASIGVEPPNPVEPPTSKAPVDSVPTMGVEPPNALDPPMSKAPPSATEVNGSAPALAPGLSSIAGSEPEASGMSGTAPPAISGVAALLANVLRRARICQTPPGRCTVGA